MKNKILIIDLIGNGKANQIAEAYPRLKENFVLIDFVGGQRDGLNENYAGVIISGSPTHVHEKTENPWIDEIESYMKGWLKNYMPVLGICFGLQLFADLNGRAVIENQIGRNMGRAQMILGGDIELDHYIFKDLILDKNREIEIFCSHLYHVEPSKDVVGYLKNSHGYNIPMLEINKTFVGLQFHPEFSTQSGLDALIELVENRRELLLKDDKDPNAIIADLLKVKLEGRDRPSLKFLTNFVDYCLGGKSA